MSSCLSLNWVENKKEGESRNGKLFPNDLDRFAVSTISVAEWVFKLQNYQVCFL